MLAFILNAVYRQFVRAALQGISSQRPGAKDMTEIITAVGGILSVSMFVAHAYDAYWSR